MTNFNIEEIKTLIASLSPDFIRPTDGPIPLSIVESIK